PTSQPRRLTQASQRDYLHAAVSCLSALIMPEGAMEAPQSSPGTPMIEAIGLCKFYGDFAAVRDITFSIPKAQVVAFLGPNGAGKSTTMRRLSGYLAPTAGTARIAGHDMQTDRLNGAAKLGYLPEN